MIDPRKIGDWCFYSQLVCLFLLLTTRDPVDGYKFALTVILLSPVIAFFWAWGGIRRYRKAKAASEATRNKIKSEFDKLKEKKDV